MGDLLKEQAAGFSERLFSFNIDLSMLMVVFVLLSFLIADNLTLYACCVSMVFLYYTIMESSQRQATIGKLYVGLKVVNREGMRLSIGFAALRTLLKLCALPLLIFAIGSMYLRRDRRALHDIPIKTSVLKARENADAAGR